MPPLPRRTSVAAGRLLAGAALLLLSLRPAAALVHLRATPLFFTFLDAPARFAVPIDRKEICGSLHVADPLDACSMLLHSGFRSYGSDANSSRFVLIIRGGCSFEEKVRNAQDAGFGSAIVYDDQEISNLYSMIGDSAGINIHAVFVSKMAGETMKKFARGEEGECCIEPSIDENAGTMLVVSFVSLIVILSVLASFMLARNSRFLRHGAQNRPLSMKKEAVEILPCSTFSASYVNSKSTTETCAICLEDYKDGETLRILPCLHDFHLVCVDSWLTKWGTCCPVCKHDVSSK